jgi:hypothetical protein
VLVGKFSRIVVASSAPVRRYGVICETTEGGFLCSSGRVWYRVWKTQVRE